MGKIGTRKRIEAAQKKNRGSTVEEGVKVVAEDIDSIVENGFRTDGL